MAACLGSSGRRNKLDLAPPRLAGIERMVSGNHGGLRLVLRQDPGWGEAPDPAGVRVLLLEMHATQGRERSQRPGGKMQDPVTDYPVNARGGYTSSAL